MELFKEKCKDSGELFIKACDDVDGEFIWKYTGPYFMGGGQYDSSMKFKTRNEKRKDITSEVHAQIMLLFMMMMGYVGTATSRENRKGMGFIDIYVPRLVLPIVIEIKKLFDGDGLLVGAVQALDRIYDLEFVIERKEYYILVLLYGHSALFDGDRFMRMHIDTDGRLKEIVFSKYMSDPAKQTRYTKRVKKLLADRYTNFSTKVSQRQAEKDLEENSANQQESENVEELIDYMNNDVDGDVTKSQTEEDLEESSDDHQVVKRRKK